MSNDPADVTGAKDNLARSRSKEVFHSSQRLCRMSSIVANNSLWESGSSASIKDVKRMVALNGNIILELLSSQTNPLHLIIPVQVSAGGIQNGASCVPLENNSMGGLVSTHVDGLVQHLFVRDDLVDLDTAGSSDDQLGLGVVDTLLDLQRSESSKDDAVSNSEAGTCKHRNQGLWHHGHVDKDHITLLKTMGSNDTSASLNLI